MRKIGNICSLIIIFANNLPIFLHKPHTTFILQNFGLNLAKYKRLINYAAEVPYLCHRLHTRKETVLPRGAIIRFML